MFGATTSVLFRRVKAAATNIYCTALIFYVWAIQKWKQTRWNWIFAKANNFLDSLIFRVVFLLRRRIGNFDWRLTQNHDEFRCGNNYQLMWNVVEEETFFESAVVAELLSGGEKVLQSKIVFDNERETAKSRAIEWRLENLLVKVKRLELLTTSTSFSWREKKKDKLLAADEIKFSIQSASRRRTLVKKFALAKFLCIKLT